MLYGSIHLNCFKIFGVVLVLAFISSIFFHKGFLILSRTWEVVQHHTISEVWKKWKKEVKLIACFKKHKDMHHLVTIQFDKVSMCFKLFLFYFVISILSEQISVIEITSISHWTICVYEYCIIYRPIQTVQGWSCKGCCRSKEVAEWTGVVGCRIVLKNRVCLLSSAAFFHTKPWWRCNVIRNVGPL